MTWEDLLSSKRVLMVSEAGAGKTYECRERAQRLWDAGEPTFFVELARLAEEDLRNLLDHDEEARAGRLAFLAIRHRDVLPRLKSTN